MKREQFYFPSLFCFCSRFAAIHRPSHDTYMTPRPKAFLPSSRSATPPNSSQFAVHCREFHRSQPDRALLPSAPDHNRSLDPAESPVNTRRLLTGNRILALVGWASFRNGCFPGGILIPTGIGTAGNGASPRLLSRSVTRISARGLGSLWQLVLREGERSRHS